MAASGKQNVNGGFSAMNSKRWLTCPDPERTVEPSVAQRQVTERSGHAASWLTANFSAIPDVDQMIGIGRQCAGNLSVEV